MRVALREVVYAMRRLWGSPVFTISATLILAMTIGATASVFSVVDGVLLKPFPYRDADRVLTLWESSPERHVPQSLVAPATYFDWQSQNTVFRVLAGAGPEMPFIVTGAHEAEPVGGLPVTPNYFAALGITPVVGRPLSADSGGPPEVVISYGFWQRRFGGAPSAVGQTLTLDNPSDPSPTPNHAYTIVGVMPAGVPGSVDLWTRVIFDPDNLAVRDLRWVSVYGRLKPGVTAEGARREMETIARRLGAAYPQTNSGWSVRTVPLSDRLVGPVQPALIMLLLAAACVLLIGAANLANLFLVRCLAREREMALRSALGATRGRLVRELLAEAGTLGVGAGVLAVGVAVAGVRALRVLAPSSLPRLSEIGVDGRVVAFCAFTTIATVLVFGLLPAWQASRGDLAAVLKEGGRGTGSAQRHRLQDGLVVLQVTVALVLLTGAGLLAESFGHFLRMDPGFRSEGVLTAVIGVPDKRYPTPERRGAFLTSLVAQLAAQPGIEAASVSGTLPGKGDRPVLPFSVVGDPAPEPNHTPAAQVLSVSPDYFRTMGISIRRGRGLLPTDDRRAVRVAVVDELLARRFFGGRDPLGQRIASPVGFGTMEIVGVVATVKENGLVAADVPAFYVPYAQILDSSLVRSTNVAVRTSGDPAAQTRTVRQAISGLDPMVPVSDIKTMSDRMVQSIGTIRFSTFLASLFAVVAFALGLVGIYSMLAYIVSQQEREIAVRIALGAHRSHVMGAVLQHALALTGIGIACGSAIAWVLTRALANLFLGISPHDPRIFAGAAVAFAVVALVAASLPALRTTRVNPAVALTST